MVSFKTFVVCVSTLMSVCCARSGHAHIHRNQLQARAGYNGTETTNSLPIGTAIATPGEYTFTVTQTNTKFVTLAYTLGNGVVKTTVITKTEESVQTTAHVKSTVTVTPIVKATLSTYVPLFVPVASVSLSKSTSTRTLVVTVTGSETATATATATANIAAFAAASSASPACSVQTVYVPQYVTLYSTVTVTATPIPVSTPFTPLYSNNTMIESTRPFESTSTTTLSLYTTVYVQSSAI